MTDRTEQRLDRRRCRGTPGALAQQPDQRGAVTVVGLKPTRAQLRPRGLGLRRREQPQRPRPAAFDLGRPRPMQRAGRLDPDHRLADDAAAGDQPRELLDTVAQHRQRHRIADQPPLARRQPHAVADLPRIDRDHQPITRQLCEQQTWGHLPVQIEKKRPSRSAPTRASFNAALSSYQLRSSARLGGPVRPRSPSSSREVVRCTDAIGPLGHLGGLVVEMADHHPSRSSEAAQRPALGDERSSCRDARPCSRVWSGRCPSHRHVAERVARVRAGHVAGRAAHQAGRPDPLVVEIRDRAADGVRPERHAERRAPRSPPAHLGACDVAGGTALGSASPVTGSVRRDD